MNSMKDTITNTASCGLKGAPHTWATNAARAPPANQILVRDAVILSTTRNTTKAISHVTDI